MHTSTITVAVLREPTPAEVKLDARDLEFKTCRGSGAGGQHRNVTDSAVQLTHLPTGIRVRVESERSQHLNRDLALALLRARLKEAEQLKKQGARNAKRRSQVGSGMRADKRRTVAVQRGTVLDHITNKTMSYKRYARGYLEDLW